MSQCRAVVNTNMLVQYVAPTIALDALPGCRTYRYNCPLRIVLKVGTQTRAKRSGSILSFDRSMNPEPTIMLIPLIKINPVYDPCPTMSNAPAAGLPTKDLAREKRGH